MIYMYKAACPYGGNRNERASLREMPAQCLKSQGVTPPRFTWLPRLERTLCRYEGNVSL